MPKSRQQLEADVSSFLDRLGENETNFETKKELKGIEYYLALSAANFVLRVQDNLNKLNKVDTGGLSSEIETSEVIQRGGNYSITLGYPAGSEAAKYYDFVNKGVKGFDSGTPNSKYKFEKILNKRGGILIGSKMSNNISGWLTRNGVRPKERFSTTAKERKSRGLYKMVSEASKKKSLAYAVAVNIKKKGIAKTGYFDEAIKYSFGQEFANTLSKLVGREIQLTVKAIQPNGNNNQ
jgi:hypothetical protein